MQSNKDHTLREIVRMLTDVQSLADLPHRIAAQEHAQVGTTCVTLSMLYPCIIM